MSDVLKRAENSVEQIPTQLGSSPLPFDGVDFVRFVARGAGFTRTGHKYSFRHLFGDFVRPNKGIRWVVAFHRIVQLGCTVAMSNNRMAQNIEQHDKIYGISEIREANKTVSRKLMDFFCCYFLYFHFIYKLRFLFIFFSFRFIYIEIPLFKIYLG